MGPSSGWLVVLTWVIALAAAVSVVALWSRLARPTVWSVLARGVTQLVTMALAVLAVATTLNYQNGWYATWSDLGSSMSGSGNPAGFEAHGGAAPLVHYDVASVIAGDQRAARSYGSQRRATAKALDLQADPGPSGQFRTVDVPGGTFGGGPGQVLIWFPPSYASASARHRQYPVIEAFHGAPGSPKDYQGTARLVPTMKALIASGKLAESVVVMPNYTPRGYDTECLNSDSIAMETWLTQTVPNWIDRHLRVMSDRTAWATLGYSAGGWCSAMAGTLHPSRYAASIVLGGYFAPQFGNFTPVVANLSRYNLVDQLRVDPPRTALWVQIASADHLSGKVSKQFVRAVRAPTSVTSVTYPDAGHRMAVWVEAMPGALSWLGRTLPAFSQDGSAGLPLSRKSMEGTKKSAPVLATEKSSRRS